MKKIGILIPCFNEEENVEEVYYSVRKEIDALKHYDWKIIYADNASTDKTVEKINCVVQMDSRVQAILNESNYGPYRSTANGLYNFKDCDAVIDITADSNEPCSLIPQYIQKWEEGYKVVLAQYNSRTQKGFISLCRKLYYRLLQSISDTTQLQNVTGVGLFDKAVIDMIRELDEPEPKFRYLVSELGYKIATVSYERQERKKGRSYYNFVKYYREAVESVVGNSTLPLHIASLLGFLISTISFVVALFYLIYKLIYWDAFLVGTAPLVIGLFFMGGIQLFFIGIIGEYLNSVLKKVTKRPLVIEKEKINFANDIDKEKYST